MAPSGSGSIRITGLTGAVAVPDGAPDPDGSTNVFVVALDNLMYWE